MAKSWQKISELRCKTAKLELKDGQVGANNGNVCAQKAKLVQEMARSGPKISHSRNDIGSIIKICDNHHFCLKNLFRKGLRGYFGVLEGTNEGLI